MYNDDYKEEKGKNKENETFNSRKDSNEDEEKEVVDEEPIVLGGEVDGREDYKKREGPTDRKRNDYDGVRTEYPERPARVESPKNERREPRKKKEKKQGGRMSYFVVALVAAIIGGLVSQFIAPYIFVANDGDEGTEIEDKGANSVINTSDDINTVSAVAKGSMSSVVGITTVELQQDFFFMREVEGVGSGVIIDESGYILTNSHVVGDGKVKSLEVLFDDGEKIPGEVLWSDRSLDIAIVKVDETGLPAAKLGNSDDLTVGEMAIAIGNPLGMEFQRSVTAGVISGLNRTISVENILMEDLIQTDASINQGNSGGPLLNSQGEVIGINTVKVQAAEGLGFSIPINSIKPIIEQVIETGDFETVALGISGLSAEEYGAKLGIELHETEGIIVVEVSKDSPAAKAGIKSMDIITAIDGKEVNSISGLKKRLYDYKAGDKAKLDVARDSEDKVIEVIFE